MKENFEQFLEALLDDYIERSKKLKGTWHAHQCDDCGTIWEHELDQDVPAEVYDARHNCPKCGTNQRTKLRVEGNTNWPERLGLRRIKSKLKERV